MTSVSPIGSIDLPAAPVDIDIYDYLSDPVFGTMSPIEKNMGGIVQGFDMGGHAHPHNNNSSIGSSGYTSLDAIANQAVQDDDDVSFTHMGQNYSNVNDYHDAIFGDDDDDDDNQTQNTSPNAGDGGGSTTSTGSGSAGSLGGGSTGGGSTGGGSTPVVYRDIYGRRYGSQAEADAANRIIAQQQSDTPDRTIDKAIAGPDLAYDDALSLTQGVVPSQFISSSSGAVPPGSQFSYGNIGGIGDTASGFNLPPAVVDPDVGDDNLRFLNKANIYSTREYNTDPDSISNIINLDAPVSGATTTTFPTGGPGTFGSTGLPAAPVPTTEDQYLNASGVTANTTYPSGNTSTTSGIQPASSTTTQNLNQGLGSGQNTNTGNQGASNANTLTPEELEKLKASLGEQVPISGVEKVINQVIGSAFFGLGSGLADKLRNSSEAERQAIVDQHLDALNSGATPVYNDEGEYVGFNMNTMDTFADKVLGADDIMAFMPPSSGTYQNPAYQADADGDGVPDYERFQQIINAQETAAATDPFGQSTEQGFITSDGREFFVDAGGNLVEVSEGTVPFEIGGGDSAVDIFNIASGSDDDDDDNDTTDVIDTGHTVTDDGIVCNTEGYVYNPETKICEPAKETETSDDVNVNIGSGTSGTSFDDVLSNVVIPAPDIAPISANIQPMKMGGMAGLNRAADNFIKALAG